MRRYCFKHVLQCHKQTAMSVMRPRRCAHISAFEADSSFFGDEELLEMTNSSLLSKLPTLPAPAAKSPIAPPTVAVPIKEPSSTPVPVKRLAPVSVRSATITDTPTITKSVRKKVASRSKLVTITASDAEKTSNKPVVDLKLTGKLMSRLNELGIESLFPVQHLSLEVALRGEDLMGRSPTGTGKTLAFVLPIVHKLTEERVTARGRSPRALVLAPTRELAVQVAKEFSSLAPWLKVVPVYGGAPFGPQERMLFDGCDVVVGTPGRVEDHLGRGTLQLREVKFAVLDEADEMLRTGFAEDVERIYEYLPRDRQNMLWSATVPEWVRSIADNFMHEPVFIDLIGGMNTMRIPDTVQHFAVTVNNKTKLQILSNVIDKFSKGGRTLIFTETKRTSANLGLTDVITSRAVLNGDMSQPVREQALDSFRRGDIKTLIATDVAARGLDIPNVETVIHFDLPLETDRFVHRTGRTGRAGKQGVNVVLFNRGEERELEKLETEMDIKFKFIAGPSAASILQDRVEDIVERVSSTDPADIALYLPAAKAIMASAGQAGSRSLAAALVHVAKLPSMSASYSLLFGDEDRKTVLVHGSHLGSSAKASQLIQEYWPGFSSALFPLVKAQGGFLVDLPPERAAALVYADDKVFSVPTALPRLLEQLHGAGGDSKVSFKNATHLKARGVAAQQRGGGSGSGHSRKQEDNRFAGKSQNRWGF